MGKIGLDQLATLEKIAERLERRIDKRFDRLEGKDSRMKAWVYQPADKLTKYGEEKTSWYVGWRDPLGKPRKKSCGPGADGRSKAKKLARKIDAELTVGTYGLNSDKTFSEFQDQYERDIVSGLADSTQEVIRIAFDNFKRIISPGKMIGITTECVDRFIAKRRSEPGRKKGDKLSPKTLNKELRHLKAAFKRAAKWKYIKEAPDVDMVAAPGRIESYVTPEHFTALYRTADKMRLPKIQGILPGDWWRAFLVYAYLTGWRVSEILGLKKSELESDSAITLAEDNKGNRDARHRLHPAILSHLQRLPSFSEYVLPWPHHRRYLDTAFGKLQELAGIELTCRRNHEHTATCHLYSFHDIRRGFATENAHLEPLVLQELMRHKHFATTMEYVRMAKKAKEAVANIKVPDVLTEKPYCSPSSEMA